MKRLLLASNNQKKFEELSRLLDGAGIAVVTPGTLGLTLAPEETGQTFYENALQKAEAFCKASDMACLADDSGLAVDALDGAPGVLSARYGDPEARTDAERNALLLRRMEGMEDRAARFVCCLVLRRPDGQILSVSGTCEGWIAREPAGTGGFGYDPVFFLPLLGLTMAQLTPVQKDEISHRGRALRRLREQIGTFIV